MYFNDEFVDAVNAHDEKQRIPREWLDHPTLGAGFRLAPSQEAADRAADGPSMDWTSRQLRDHAATIGATYSSHAKADVLAAIVAHTQTPVPDQGADETPAAGDEEEI